MVRARLFILLVAVLCGVGACASPPDDGMARAKPILNWSVVPKRIVMVRADIVLSLVTTGGIIEPQADWSREAQAALTAAVAEHLKNLEIEPLTTDDADMAADARMMRLYSALTVGPDGPGTRADLRRRAPLRDCLGPATQRLRDRYGADYGVVLYVRDNITSTGRMLSNVATGLVLATLSRGRANVHYSDASRVARLSLVDLQSGLIVWTGSRFVESGDLRDSEDARVFVRGLMKEMPH